jgi:hypothetical protein
MLLIVGGTRDDWGIIPSFLDQDDPRGAKEQFNAQYMGGWNAFQGFTLDKNTMRLKYPGNPPIKPLSYMFFRHEIIVLYESEWVLVLEPDGTWEVCRMN